MSEHARIRKLSGVQDALRELADDLAARANDLAGTDDDYGTDLEVGKDRARAHVWARTGKAIRAERKTAPLMQLGAESGPQP